MQLNKVLKGLMLALPVLAVAACSSNKSANNDQSGMGAGTGTENGSNLSSEEQARLQMQELQKNNARPTRCCILAYRVHPRGLQQQLCKMGCYAGIQHVHPAFERSAKREIGRAHV